MEKDAVATVFPFGAVPVHAVGIRGPSTPQTPVGMTQKLKRQLLSECRNKRPGLLALNLSRRDKNRADLSLDKYR